MGGPRPVEHSNNNSDNDSNNNKNNNNKNSNNNNNVPNICTFNELTEYTTHNDESLFLLLLYIPYKH